MDAGIKILIPTLSKYQELLHSENIKGLKCLEKLGLNDKDLISEFKIGFSDGEGRKYFVEHRNALRADFDLFNQNYRENLSNAVIVPILNEQDNPVRLCGKRIVNYADGGQNHVFTTKVTGTLFNHKNIKDADTVFLTDGIINTLTLIKCGYKNATAILPDNLEDIQEFIKTKKAVYLVTRNADLIDQLKGLSNIKLIEPKAPMVDVNDLLVTRGPQAVKDLIENAILQMPMEVPEIEMQTNNLQPAPIPAPVLECKQEPAQSYEILDSTLVYKSNGIIYQVRNIYDLKMSDSLKILINVTLGTIEHLDRVDLYLSRSRKTLQNHLCKNFDVQPFNVEEDLLKIMHLLEDEIKRRKEKEECKPRVKVLTKAEQESALVFLKDKNLIQRIINDYRTIGYVGEDNNKLLVYLAAISRKLRSPISVLIRSLSSSGKSYLMDSTAEFIPEEDYYKLSGLTSKALYYMPEDGLKHKVILIDEKNGMEDAEYSIRSLQSAGKLTLAVPLKNKNGDTETLHITKYGPISYMDAATDMDTHPENANRCYEIFLDETEEQTRQIQALQKKTKSLMGLEKLKEVEEIKILHRNAQRMLKSIKVVIPFNFDFPCGWVRTRRDHQRFLSLIEVVTFLHQYQREQKEHAGEVYIEATPEDYEIAFKLANAVLFNTFNDLDKPTYDFYAKVNEFVQKKAEQNRVDMSQYWFTRRDLRLNLNLPDHFIKRKMQALTELEYFEVKSGNQGTRHFYRIERPLQKLELISGLTTPEELKKKLQEEQLEQTGTE